MEIENQELPKKSPRKRTVTITTIRADKKTARKLQTLVTKANKKGFGKRIRSSDIILLALGLVEEQHITELQEASYSSKDRIEIEYLNYCKRHGSISKDEFLAKLLHAGLPQVEPHTPAGMTPEAS